MFDVAFVPAASTALLIWLFGISWNFMYVGALGGTCWFVYVWMLYLECDLHITPAGRHIYHQVTTAFDDLRILRSVGGGVYTDARVSRLFGHWKIGNVTVTESDFEIRIVAPIFLIRLLVSRLKDVGYVVEESRLSSFRLT